MCDEEASVEELADRLDIALLGGGEGWGSSRLAIDGSRRREHGGGRSGSPRRGQVSAKEGVLMQRFIKKLAATPAVRNTRYGCSALGYFCRPGALDFDSRSSS